MEPCYPVHGTPRCLSSRQPRLATLRLATQQVPAPGRPNRVLRPTRDETHNAGSGLVYFSSVRHHGMFDRGVALFRDQGLHGRCFRILRPCLLQLEQCLRTGAAFGPCSCCHGTTLQRGKGVKRRQPLASNLRGPLVN